MTFDDIDLTNLSAVDDVNFHILQLWRTAFGDSDLSNMSAAR